MYDKIVEIQRGNEPRPDIAICSQCGWRGPVEECGEDTEGDWESGYYDVDTCPKCSDGGCIDDYDMSEKRAKEWEQWHNKKNEQDFKPAGVILA